MKFSFKIGIYLVLATTIAMLVAIGGAYQLTVTERLDQANAEAQRQRIVAKLEELVSTMESAETATLNYLIDASEQNIAQLRAAEARFKIEIAYLANFVSDSPEQQHRVAALEATYRARLDLRQQAIALRRQKGANAALSLISGPAYEANARERDRVVDEIRREERYLAAQRDERFAARTRQLAPFTAWSALMAIGLALFAAAAINSQRVQRRLAETHLREQEKKYRLVTGSVPAMIGYIDRRHRLQFPNRAVEEWFESPAERITNRHLAEIMGNEAYMAILPGIERALRGKRVEYEGKAYRRDGSERMHAGTFIPDRDDAGQVIGIFAMVIDITERKAAEEALRASEARWKFALEGAGDGVWDRDMLTDEVVYSKRYKEMLGYSEDEFANRREEWLKRIHPEDTSRVMAELQAYLDGKCPAYTCEYRMLCKDGSWKWILTRGVAVSRTPQGTPLRMIGTHADISMRVRQQEEIVRANERLDLALQGSRMAIWDVDIASGKIYVSEAWAEMLGDPPAEMATDARALFELVHPDDRERIAEAYTAALKGSSSEYRIEHRVRTRAGKWKWVLSHGRVVTRDGAGRALRMTGTNADISARKEIEHMKSEFVAVVSHELRTPLSSIVGALGLLAGMTGLREDVEPLIRVARDNAQRLARLVNDILDVEKLDSDTMQIQLEPVDLKALLATAVQANQGYADQYGVSLALADSEGQAWVTANSDRLMQVMTNLLSNAAKFSPRGARVEVRLARARDAYRVSVIDSGPGIPDEFKPRVFERFAQADSSTSRQRGGTGLGLAICKKIMDKLGGNINFVSAPGMGTTFYFDLPPSPQSAQHEAPGHGAMRI